MKPLPAAALLAFAMGLGAFAHHLRGAVGASPDHSARIAGADRAPTAASGTPAPRRRSIDSLTSSLQEIFNNPRMDWIRLTETLEAVPPEEFLPLWAAIAREKGGSGGLHHTVLDYWAAADTASLLHAAEKREHGLALADVLGRCFRYQPGLVIAAIQRKAVAASAGPIVEESADGGPDTQDLEKDKDPRNLWSSALWNELQRDPAATLALAVKHDALKYLPSAILQTTMTKWTAEDAPAAMRLAEKHTELFYPALEGWLTHHPDDALAWIAAHPDRVTEGPWMLSSIAAYAGNHPVEAERLYAHAVNDDANPFIDAKVELRRAQATGMAWRPVNEAAAWIGTLSGDEHIVACKVIVETLARYNPGKAVAFWKAVPDFPANDRVVLEAFSEFGKFHPAEAAARDLAPNDTPAEVRVLCLPAVMESWLVLEPEVARQFIDREPPSELKGRLLLQASGLMADGGPGPARDYALTLPDPDTKLGACRAVLNGSHWKSDAARNEWIAGIPDPAIRTAVQAELVKVRKRE